MQRQNRFYDGRESMTDIDQSKCEPRRLLIASCIRQDLPVLTRFLVGLDHLIIPEGWRADTLLQANGNEPDTDLVLEAYAQARSATLWRRDNPEAYVKTEETHFWPESQTARMGAFKDEIIQYALDSGYDALFLVDSDLVLHPQTLVHLEQAKQPIVAEIFWTSWQPGTIPMPNAWLQDVYSMYYLSLAPTADDQAIQSRAFMQKLREPGVYAVGGLGACTWLRREALVGGVRFALLPNLSFWGEDRHFCVRAAALGFPLHIDTHVPAFHIYRQTELPAADEYLRRFVPDWPGMPLD